MDEMLTMFPPPWRVISRAQAWVSMMGATRLAVICASIAFGGMVKSSSSRTRPALLTSRSSLPNTRWTFRTKARAVVGSPRSTASQ